MNYTEWLREVTAKTDKTPHDNAKDNKTMAMQLETSDTLPADAFDEPVYHPVHDADITQEQRQMISVDLAALNAAYARHGTQDKPRGLDFDALSD